MFTGLVKTTGTVREIEEKGEGKRIRVESSLFKGTEKGESISVSGACLTVEKRNSEEATFFLAEETLDKTWFDEISAGDELNLEQSLRADDRMGGHIVQGHVEDTSEILEIEEVGDADCSCGESACRSNSEKCSEGWNFTFSKPSELDNYIVEKGFIAVEGISLTVTEVDDNSFSVTIIPETWNVTNLSEKSEGDQVNIETDITGRYVEKMVEAQKS